MKELINEWRKYVKEVKELGGLGSALEKVGAGEQFLKGMLNSRDKREREISIVVAFVESSHKLNNIFEEALKIMEEYDFSVAPIFRPDPDNKKILNDSNKYFQCARDIVVIMSKMIKEEGEEEIVKRLGLPNIFDTYVSLSGYKEDEREASQGKGFTMRLMSVRHVVEFFNRVAHEIKKDPEKMRKMKERDIAPEMKPFEAPSTSDSEFDLEPEYTLDYAKKIRNRDTYKTEKEINEKKNKK